MSWSFGYRAEGAVASLGGIGQDNPLFRLVMIENADSLRPQPASTHPPSYFAVSVDLLIPDCLTS